MASTRLTGSASAPITSVSTCARTPRRQLGGAAVNPSLAALAPPFTVTRPAVRTPASPVPSPNASTSATDPTAALVREGERHDPRRVQQTARPRTIRRPDLRVASDREVPDRRYRARAAGR